MTIQAKFALTISGSLALLISGYIGIILTQQEPIFHINIATSAETDKKTQLLGISYDTKGNQNLTLITTNDQQSQTITAPPQSGRLMTICTSASDDTIKSTGFFQHAIATWTGTDWNIVHNENANEIVGAQCNPSSKLITYQVREGINNNQANTPIHNPTFNTITNEIDTTTSVQLENKKTDSINENMGVTQGIAYAHQHNWNIEVKNSLGKYTIILTKDNTSQRLISGWNTPIPFETRVDFIKWSTDDSIVFISINNHIYILDTESATYTKLPQQFNDIYELKNSQ